MPGVFAVGDVRAGSMKRVAAASGEGSSVVPLVHSYLETLAAMIDAGEIAPVIDRIVPFADVPAALRHLEEGHPRGKVVITVAEP